MWCRRGPRWESRTTETVRIRIGNQTSFSALTVTHPFEYAVANSFDAFEWFPDKKKSGAGWTESDISEETRVLIRDTALAYDIRLSVHASLQSNPLNPEAREHLFKAIEFAQDIGAPLLNTHLYTDEGISAFVEAIIPLVKRLAQAGIKLSIENTPDTRPEDFNEVFRYLRRINTTNAAHVGMCLDVGHANLCSVTRNDYLKFIDLIDPHVPIVHIHMHENYGDYDSHLPLFTGPAGKDATGIKELIKCMKKRNFSGSIIFEQWPQPPTQLNEARDRLREMISKVNPTIQCYGCIKGDFADKIAEADRRFRSWRKKLGWIYDLFADDTSDLNTEQLIYIAIYLRFIGTGEVSCSEDGGHYRPSYHARMARQIYDRLSRITTPENVFIIRKIYPWLPSFDSAFTRAEPLTHIRDIAHRNDIPQELKREIKNTLQNKLHRCAGPEDLFTSEALLKRITAPDADYSPAFVEEFRQFYEELKEFFNASSLEKQLETVIKIGTVREIGLIRDFLEAKGKADSPEQVLTTLELLTMLRGQFNERLQGNTSSEGQQLQMADIRLENFSFVLLSQLINYFVTENDRIPWALALHCLALTIEDLRLSGFDAEECQAIQSELKVWYLRFDPRGREQLIRLKAALDRCRRLAEVYCNKILTFFPEKVERLGRDLGVAEHAIKVFSEADIRSHPVFQLSKLVTILLKSIRSRAALPLWDIIVPGKVSGRLVAAPGLNDLSGCYDEPIVALLEKTEGDEEIPAGVVGIIAAHETPHLSHLAVRVRQGNVVFVMCEDANYLSGLKYLLGKHLILDVSAEKVSLEISSSPGVEGMNISDGKIQQVRVPEVFLSSGHKLLPIDQVTLTTGGSKAAAARRLEELSRLEGAGFKTPSGFVIPFGVMEESLHSEPALEEEYRVLAKGLNEQPQNDFANALKRLIDIIGQLQAPCEIVSGMMKIFRRNERLMVRSSANCEDLEGFAGAGLYNSVANVPPHEIAHAVSKVWSSLWNKRAVMSRRNAGIRHDRAHMAVLVQQMIVPEFSFIMHTVNPINHNHDEIYVELAVGLGETLASGETPGIPYRMVCNKHTGAVRMLAFASISQAVMPDPAGGLICKTVDYSRIELSRDEAFRNHLGIRLGAIGRFVEDALGRPQDIEGLVLGDAIYLVQSRPQQGGV